MRLQGLYLLAESNASVNNHCLGQVSQPYKSLDLLQKSQKGTVIPSREGLRPQSPPEHKALQPVLVMQILTQAGRGLLGEQVASENLFSCLFIILGLEFQHGLGLVFCQPQGFQIKICQSKGQVLQPAKENNNCLLNLPGQEGASPQLQTAPPEQRETEPGCCGSLSPAHWNS